MNLGFDIDGVLYNFVDSFRDYLITDKGYSAEQLSAEPSNYAFFTSWGLSREEFEFYCNLAGRDGKLFSGPPDPENLSQTFKRLKSSGHDITIISARYHGPDPHGQTLDWLTKNDIPYDNLVMSADKSIVHTDVYIDDFLSNLAKLPKTTYPYLMDRPWNQYEPMFMSAHRVYSLDEMIDHALSTRFNAPTDTLEASH